MKTAGRVGRALRHSASLAVACGAFAALAALPAHAETRTYVVGWFSQATYSQESDCPGGENPDITKQWLKDLADLGYTPQQIQELAGKEAEGQSGGELRTLMVNRARVNGQPANALAYPEYVKDPQLKASVSKYAYGFNLDGKGASTPKGLEDPQTHEKGVNDELARALGCMRPFRGSLLGRPTYYAWAWGQLKDSQPAWLVTISGESLSKDGPVTITLDRAMEHLRSNVDGSPREDSTYRIDPDPRSHNVLKGELKGHTISVEQPFDFRMLQNPLVAPELKLTRAKFRINLKSDGSLDGILGGYLSWADFYASLASQGPGLEACITGDIPGIYYLLKKHADADPDPKTGQNASISSAFYLEAVPAFIATVEQTSRPITAANTSG
jgi:hypothetical protein